MQINVGKKLKILRKKILKMSQRDFAAFIDVHIRNVQNWEQGVSTPSFETIVHISEKCDVSIDWIAGRCGYIDQNVSELLELIHAVLTTYGELPEEKKRILENYLKAAK